MTGAWGRRGWERDEMGGGRGQVGGGLFMPSVLPDFGTNIKNGHEERIRDHEQTERCTEEEKPGQRSRLVE